MSAIRAIGRIDQVGFVVDDLEAAIAHWSGKLGVGPFFVSEHVPYKTFTYYGQETPIDLSLAFSYIGPLQIELIKQHNDVPSMYQKLKKSAPNGLVHMAKYVDDLDAAAAPLIAAGNPVIQYSCDEGGVETLYLETDLHNGGLIEFIRVPDGHKPYLDLIREAVADWDGARPLRRIDPDNPMAAFA